MTTSSSPDGFASLGLPDAVLATLAGLGYATPSAVQAQAIPHLIAGRDVLGIAQTGTGKTAAFALPLVVQLLTDGIDAGRRGRAPKAVVLTPTRELAQQVAAACQRYAGDSPLRVVAVYGGAPPVPQMQALKAGADIVVGTPGRLMDHMRRGNLATTQLRTLVLDEADEMLRMGFIDDVEWVLSHTPEQRQIALFSATMPREIQRIVGDYLREPAQVRIQHATTTAETIRQRYVLVQPHQKLDLLDRLLQTEATDAVMVFVRTKLATTEVADGLRARGHAAEALSGDLTQEARDTAVARLKAGQIDIIVATDVAARGLDVDRISHVINYDVPFDAEAYTHRIGRTGRAGRSGEAILFLAPREQRKLKMIEARTRGRLAAMTPPTVDQVNASRLAALVQRLSGHLGTDTTAARELVDRLAGETGLSDRELAVALAAEVAAQHTGGGALWLDASDELRPPGKGGQPAKPGNRRERRAAAAGGAGRETPRSRTPAGPVEAGMARYRVSVGHAHGVKPGNLVGAIANEAGLDAKHIGRIDLYEQYAVVDLPEGMPKPIFQHLKGVWVCGRQLDIAPDDGTAPDARADDAPRKRRAPGGKSGHKPAGKPAGKSASKSRGAKAPGGKPAAKAKKRVPKSG